MGAIILRPLKKFEYAKEAAQIFVFGARDVLIDTARSENQKCAAKLTRADSDFLSESSIIVYAYLSRPTSTYNTPRRSISIEKSGGRTFSRRGLLIILWSRE